MNKDLWRKIYQNYIIELFELAAFAVPRSCLQLGHTAVPDERKCSPDACLSWYTVTAWRKKFESKLSNFD